MRDPRINQLAKNLVQYSVDIQPGENVLVEMIGSERELLSAIIEEVQLRKGCPFTQLTDPSIQRKLLLGATEAYIEQWKEWDLLRMQRMDAYIGIRSGENVNEFADIPDEKMGLYDRLYRHPIHSEERVKRTKWVVLRFPNASMAQLANQSTESFAQFYFDVCNLDYRHMSEAMDALVAYMNKTDRVRIVSPGTDLRFSIKGLPAIKCDGRLNIPDGEVFTAPVRESVEGTIAYNTPSIYAGVTFENIRLRFERGKIIEADSNQPQRLNELLDSDAGARYIGEFSLGFHPLIKHPMKDTLFDEKIDGSLHFTPGQAYELADNGNRSAIHWDLVLIQREEFGGGEIYFDDQLIRKDGRFVVPELAALNPEQLLKHSRMV